MTRLRITIAAVATAATFGGMLTPAPGASAGTTDAAGSPVRIESSRSGGSDQGGTTRQVRFATYNASLNRTAAGELAADLSTPDDSQAGAVAEVIQRVRPDVLLINEFDYDPEGTALRRFQENYLSVSRNESVPIRYRYRYAAPSNTGVPSGFDLDNNGNVGGAGDAFGFGNFPGQFGMAVYSRYPIEYDAIRTFRMFRWQDMPGARLPDDPATPAPGDWYSAEELAEFRLSSKSHWDIPVRLGGRSVHFLVSHPTPPVFDGPEDRNGMRNADEIRFWTDYVACGGKARYIYDDRGRRGGLCRQRFVIAGDLNSDPLDGDSLPGAAQQLLDSGRLDLTIQPQSQGAPEQALLQGGANADQRGDPRFDTADFADTTPGNLRTDYVLPSKGLDVVGAGVFWPVTSDPLFRLVGVFPFPTSDHRAVYLDLQP
ncbi:MAG: endonuclease/exonuclease/phosphatase family protein [Nocardioides sp.]